MYKLFIYFENAVFSMLCEKYMVLFGDKFDKKPLSMRTSVTKPISGIISDELLHVLPEEKEFVQILSEKLDSNVKVSKEEIYHTLFTTKLSEYTPSQFSFLSTLLHSKDQTTSKHILRSISDAFPKTELYLRNLYLRRSLLPKNGADEDQQKELFSTSSNLEEIYGSGIHFIAGIEKRLLDIFALSDNYEALYEEIWKGFLVKVKEMTGEDCDVSYISNNFSIQSYDPMSGALELNFTEEKDYSLFESKYLGGLREYFKTIHFRFTNLKYSQFRKHPTVPVCSPNSSVAGYSQYPSTIVKSNKKSTDILGTVTQKLDPLYTRENCYGSQKEKLLELLISEKNIFIGGTDTPGKSHLIQSVIKKYQMDGHKRSIVYTTGIKMYKEFQRCATEDRNTKANINRTQSINDFRSAFDGVDILIIDDVDDLGGGKVHTQDTINKIIKNGTQVVMLSSIPPAQIHWHKSIDMPSGKEYIPIPLAEEFPALLMKVDPADDYEKSNIVRSLWESKNKPNLFMPPDMASGMIKFIAEHVSPKIYQPVIDSILLDIQGNEKNPSQKIYEIITLMTGKTINPSKKEIVNVIIEEFNCDDINQYVDKSGLSGGISRDIDKQKMYNERVRDDSIEGVVLRLCVFFIKKYYPKESFEMIGQSFSRTNTSSLYKEAKEWLQQANGLEIFLDDKIKSFLKKKYGLQHDI